jgi:hypothetical protein
MKYVQEQDKFGNWITTALSNDGRVMKVNVSENDKRDLEQGEKEEAFLLQFIAAFELKSFADAYKSTERFSGGEVDILHYEAKIKINGSVETVYLKATTGGARIVTHSLTRQGWDSDGGAIYTNGGTQREEYVKPFVRIHEVKCKALFGWSRPSNSEIIRAIEPFI